MNESSQAGQGIPTSFGNYRMVRLLGKGGMGEVYLAEHPLLHKKVAAKVLSHELCRVPQQVARFQQEAVAVCRIGHPAIVEVFDFGTLSDGRVYYLMEYLEGQDLAEFLKVNGPVGPERCLEIVGPAMEALGAAHRAGIVHRDVKPDNIFLANVGGHEQVKVLDFGIAKLLDPGEGALATATRTGMILGTPVYMAPEQAAGAIQKIGPATDIYAMAVLIYHMLCGRPPFLADSQIEILMQHLKTPPPRLVLKPGEVSEALDGVLRKAMAKEPQQRYSNMEEFLAAFRQAVEAEKSKGPAGVASAAMPLQPSQATAASSSATGPGPGSLPPPPTGLSSPTGDVTGGGYENTVPQTGAPTLEQGATSATVPQPVPAQVYPGQAGPVGSGSGAYQWNAGEGQSSRKVSSMATRPGDGGIPTWAGVLLGLVGILVIVAVVALVWYLRQSQAGSTKSSAANQTERISGRRVASAESQRAAGSGSHVPSQPIYHAPGAKVLSDAEEDALEAKIDAIWQGLDPAVRTSRKGLQDPRVARVYQKLASKMGLAFQAHKYLEGLPYYVVLFRLAPDPNQIPALLSIACMAHSARIAKGIWAEMKDKFPSGNFSQYKQTCAYYGVDLP